MKKAIHVLLVVLSQLGIADSAYLTWEKLRGNFPTCGASFDCKEVLSSSYASIGPLPVSFLGLVFYTIFLVLSAAVLLNYRPQAVNRWLLIWSILGLGFSLYFIFVMGFVLSAWCLFCLLSALNCLVLFTFSSVNFYLQKESHL